MKKSAHGGLRQEINESTGSLLDIQITLFLTTNINIWKYFLEVHHVSIIVAVTGPWNKLQDVTNTSLVTIRSPGRAEGSEDIFYIMAQTNLFK